MKATNGETRGDAPNRVTAAPSTDDLTELLTVEEVAQLLRVSRSWVYDHTRSRSTPRSERLPHIKLGKYLRFDARVVRAFLEQKCRLM
jgi:excisionase family DNA binding protein